MRKTLGGCKAMTNTPETDAALAAGMDAAQIYAMLQKLERERDALQKAINIERDFNNELKRRIDATMTALT